MSAVALIRSAIFHQRPAAAQVRKTITRSLQSFAPRISNTQRARLAILQECTKDLVECHKNAVPGYDAKFTEDTHVLNRFSEKQIVAHWQNTASIRICEMQSTLECIGVKNPNVTLYLNRIYVHPHLRGMGITTAWIGDAADALKKRLGPHCQIQFKFFADGLDNENDGRIVWGKLGAEFSERISRQNFLSRCRLWLASLSPERLDTQTKAQLATLFEHTSVVKAPWILFSAIESMDKTLMKDLGRYLTSEKGVGWFGTFRIQPEPEGFHPLWGKVAIARLRRDKIQPPKPNMDPTRNA